MDLRDAAAYFQQDPMDAYNFGVGAWSAAAFKGKIKHPVESFGVNDLTAKKRMLFTQPYSRPPSSVIRSPILGDIFLVENPTGAVTFGSEYQTVFNLHQAQPALLSRMLPAGPPNNPGWALQNFMQNTFADVAFQRVPANQETQVNQYGLYIIYMPSDCPATDHDTITVAGRTYFLFEVYSDQGLRVARATVMHDVRVNFVYVVVTEGAYNPATLTPGRTETRYNVTGQIIPFDQQDTSSGNLERDAIKVLIDKTWIGVVPQINDRLEYGGKTYRISKITQNVALDQWMLTASV